MAALPKPLASVRFGVLRRAPLAPWQARCIAQLEVQGGVDRVPDIDSGAAEAITRARESAPDFLLCFVDGELPPALIDVPRFGVWRFQWGDFETYRGPAAGFWEVWDHAPASAAALVRVQADPNVRCVLRQGYLRTRWLSARQNRDQWCDRFACWPAQVCRDLQRLGRLPEPRVLRARGAPRPMPSTARRALLALRIGYRSAVTGVASLLRHDQWNVGIIDRPVEHLLTTPGPPAARWLPPTARAELRADPFGAGSTILCEHFSYREQRGFIRALDGAGATLAARVDIGPEPPVHLSYPYLMERDGRLWCMPESSAAGEVALYEEVAFPARWVRRATLVANQGVADASLFAWGGRWWIAGSEVAAKGANCELNLWHADAPEGPWTAHAGNPVKIDVRSARPAGAPFWSDGKLYRPAQDCSSTYGARVIINRILALTPDEFREEYAAEVNPDPRGPYPRGLHTVSGWGERTLIDGKRSVFVAAEFFRVLRHYLP